MIFRNSLKSIYRSFGKSALFTLIILSLTLALGLATSVWVAVDQFLKDCDEYYTTVGLFEYMGTEYPGDIIYDPRMDAGLNSLARFGSDSLSQESRDVNPLHRCLPQSCLFYRKKTSHAPCFDNGLDFPYQ